jgi:hypothetical protein
LNLSLLAPAALAALAALMLPLLIHLARRSEQRPTDFAALRWLRSMPRPRHRLRLDERLLLAARLLLIALVALWLARPVLSGAASDAPWVAVVAGVSADAAREATTDTRARLNWLAPGWPRLDAPPPPPALPVSSLLRQLDAELPADVALTVLVPEVLQGVDAERLRLSRAVEWRVLPGEMPPPAQAPAAPTPTLAVRHAPEREAAARYLRAAAGAWQPRSAPPARPAAPGVSSGPLSKPLDPGTRWLAWLAPGPLPPAIEAWIRAGGVALVDAAGVVESEQPRVVPWRDALGAPLVESFAHGEGRVLRLVRPLAPADMPQLLEPDFPQRLRALFAPLQPQPARVGARGFAPASGGAAYPQAPRDLQPWLALLIALVLLLERWLATRRRRGVAP